MAELFQKERRYTVPLYQRAYVWDRDEQWEPLWDDIERHAEGCLASESLVSKRAHFLGAIVLNVSKIVGAGVARSEVIDGQQRLTTLQIVLAAIRDYARAHGSKHVDRLTRLTVNEDEKVGSEGFFKVWPTNADREVFRAVQMEGSPSALMKALGVQTAASAPRIASAYIYFHGRVSEFIGPAADAEARDARLFGLLQALRVALQLVIIELEDGDDPQVIFETLNARGQPLLPSDLIRNYVFLQAATDPACDTDDLYERYWRPFDSERAEAVSGETRFWHVEERQGRLTRPRIDLFLFHYLVMKTEADFSIGQLFREFRSWRDAEPMGVEGLLADLAAHAKIFEKLVRPTGSDRAALLAQRLQALDNSTVYPLLMYLLSMPGDKLTPGNRDQVITDIESWLVRRFVCWLTNKNYNNFFVSVLKKVKRAASENLNVADVVRAELTRSGDATTAWPSDASFRSSWLSKPLYARSRPDRSVMILRAIELQRRTSRNEPNPVPARLTVEHLLPQKGSLADYPYAAEMPLQPDESDQRCRERLLHTIGNLTLLTGELNASVSNGPFPGKVAKIVDDSDLRLNAWLRSSPPDNWSEASIIARGEQLFQSALAIWPRVQGEPENIDDEEPSGAAGGVWRFTDAEVLRAKRADLLARLSAQQGVPLTPVSVSKASAPDGSIRAVTALSKRYAERDAFPYWYAYHPAWDEFLAEAQQGFVVFGCVDRTDAFAVPREVMQGCLNGLNTTVRRDTGKLHWHIHLVERAGRLAMLLPKREQVLELSPYALAVMAAVRQASTPVA